MDKKKKIFAFLLLFSVLLFVGSNFFLADKRPTRIRKLEEEVPQLTCSKLTEKTRRLQEQWKEWMEKKVPQYSFEQILEVWKDRHIPYHILLSNPCTHSPSSHIERHLSNSSPTPLQLNIIIVTKQRVRTLFSCLKSMNSFLSVLNLTAAVTVVEIGDPQVLNQTSFDAGVDYIYIPESIYRITGTFGLFPKSLASNLGFLLSRDAQYYLFHDVDVLVTPDLFSSLAAEIKNPSPPKYLFPYFHINRLQQNQSNDLMDLIEKDKPWLHFRSSNLLLSAQWGFSVLTSKETFQAVGGYDPEMFFGWAPEDVMFKEKLKVITPERRLDFVGLHLEHPRQPPSGEYPSDFGVSNSFHFLNLFKAWSPDEQRLFLKMKSSLLALEKP